VQGAGREVYLRQKVGCAGGSARLVPGISDEGFGRFPELLTARDCVLALLEKFRRLLSMHPADFVAAELHARAHKGACILRFGSKLLPGDGFSIAEEVFHVRYIAHQLRQDRRMLIAQTFRAEAELARVFK